MQEPLQSEGCVSSLSVNGSVIVAGELLAGITVYQVGRNAPGHTRLSLISCEGVCNSCALLLLYRSGP